MDDIDPIHRYNKLLPLLLQVIKSQRTLDAKDSNLAQAALVTKQLAMVNLEELLVKWQVIVPRS